MPQMTLAEANTQLTTVNAAIADLIAGKRITQLKVGSGAFQRNYVYEEINLASLKEYRDELLSIIDVLEPVAPKFKNNMHIPLVVSKDVY